MGLALSSYIIEYGGVDENTPDEDVYDEYEDNIEEEERNEHYICAMLETY